jgi:molybdenum cofactor cytidylyltransferase
MKFGPVPLDEALGAILAHSHAVPDGRLRKGAPLTEADIARLRAAGETAVVVARLEPGDVSEDQAAARVAATLVPDAAERGLRLTTAATGRVNFYATGPGVLQIDTAAIARVNAVDPMITVATLPQFSRVAERVMAGTVKIIAYGVPDASVAAAEAVGAALAVRPPVFSTATLIETRIGEGDPEKGEAALRGRLAPLGVALTGTVTVPHRTEAIAEAIAGSSGEVVLILTASATSDPQDVGPSAVRAAGGAVTRFGMPVDPGNLLFLGEVGGRPVIGLPGCARSPALNGADWVLERIVCGVPVGDADIAGMGVGGLLKETAARGRPREPR